MNQTMTTPETAEVAPQAPSLNWRAKLARNPEWFTASLIVLSCVIVAAINPRFLQWASLFDLLHTATTTSLFALGTLVVLASGGIDVSFTAIGALTMYSITKAVFAWWPDEPFVLILLTGAIGGIVLGVINGWLVHRLQAPSLIVTIGTQYLYRGILLTFVGTTFFMNIPHSMDHFGRAALLSYETPDGLHAVLPMSVLALFFAAALTWWLLNRTMMGRGVYAMGGSPVIAERLGYNLRAIRLFVFGYTGFLAGIAGILHVSNNRLANPIAKERVRIENLPRVSCRRTAAHRNARRVCRDYPGEGKHAAGECIAGLVEANRVQAIDVGLRIVSARIGRRDLNDRRDQSGV
jgi:simple sugar transport system permease protein